MTKFALQINKICLAAMFLALGWLFPFITMQIPEFGNMLLPMHIPVFLSGFVLGPVYGAFIGFITPITRTLIFGNPPLVPTSLSMMFELATYGGISGLLFMFLTKNKKMSKLDSLVPIYISLIVAMIAGRIVGGFATYLFTFLKTDGSSYSWTLYWSSFFVTAWPGMLLQIILIPAIIRLLYGLKLIQKFMPSYHLKNKEVEEEEINNNTNEKE